MTTINETLEKAATRIVRAKTPAGMDVRVVVDGDTLSFGDAGAIDALAVVFIQNSSRVYKLQVRDGSMKLVTP